ncbi:Lysophospholipase L1 [Onishia taeanensis]|uniref:Lysophospholipase L1 n=2 Tax=Onishia taeanensis TaxID=284577 RepID=A0A1G7N0W8_9GAMM|nr:Lysophospholipase L1 [Halomonas taeanensis]
MEDLVEGIVTGFPVGLKRSKRGAKGPAERKAALSAEPSAWKRRYAQYASHLVQRLGRCLLATAPAKKSVATSTLTMRREPLAGLMAGLCMGLAALCMAAPALADASSADSRTDRPTLLVMGDSLSAAYGLERPEDGWVSLLAMRLEGEARVVNASISGETSAGGATRLPKLLGQHSPDIVLLELGANDGLRGLAPSQMRRNLESMIEKSQASGARVMLLGIDIPPNYGDAYRQAFTGVFDDLAERHELPLVPFLLEGVALQDALMQDDGLHPTAEAQPIILDNVWPTLAPLLEQAKPEAAAGKEAISPDSSAAVSPSQPVPGALPAQA